MQTLTLLNVDMGLLFVYGFCIYTNEFNLELYLDMFMTIRQRLLLLIM